MPSVVARRATLQDYQDVLDIGIAYDGMDYLPSFYKELVTDPDYLCYVCEVDGEIVGFECALLHDGRRVVQGRAGRIKPTHRGMGYLHCMRDQLTADLDKIVSLEAVVQVRMRNSINWITLDPSWEHIDSSNLYDGPILKSRCNNFISPSSVTRMCEGDFQALFETPSVCKRFFPSNIVYVQSLSLGLDKANIRHIVNDNSRAFATIKSTETQTKTSDVKSGDVNPENIHLLTIGWYFWAPKGQRCGITIFGTDFKTLDAHIQAHLNETPSSTDLVNLAFYTSHSLPFEVIESIYDKYGAGFYMYPMCTLRKTFEPKTLKAKY